MDLQFQIDKGQKSYVEKIDIRGNLKTKDKVIRRELAISPGEIFDMVRVKISKQRLEGLQYFDKVDLQPEPTDPPIAGHKDLVVNVEEHPLAGAREARDGGSAPRRARGAARAEARRGRESRSLPLRSPAQGGRAPRRRNRQGAPAPRDGRRPRDRRRRAHNLVFRRPARGRRGPADAQGNQSGRVPHRPQPRRRAAPAPPEIASGGELSRSLLALKRVLAGSGPAGLYVFDEVDAGVGGAVAEVIGRAIADVRAPPPGSMRDALAANRGAGGRALRHREDGGEGEDEGDAPEARGGRRGGQRDCEDNRGVTVGKAARRAAEELLARRCPRHAGEVAGTAPRLR